MKTKVSVFAAIVLVAVILIVILNAIFVVRKTDEHIAEVQAVAPEAASESIRELYARFQKSERIINLTVSHEDLTNIEACFAEWIGAAEVGDRDAAAIAKSRLTDALIHLRRLSSFNFDSIF